LKVASTYWLCPNNVTEETIANVLDVLGVGCLLYETMTAEVVNEDNLTFQEIHALVNEENAEIIGI
jgi:hypothetical protein